MVMQRVARAILAHYLPIDKSNTKMAKLGREQIVSPHHCTLAILALQASNLKQNTVVCMSALVGMPNL